MANNDPSPADIARLQKEQEAMEQRERDRELQAEFDEADRVERERLTKQKNYDLERERVERERAAQARKDKFQMERAERESKQEADRKLQQEFAEAQHEHEYRSAISEQQKKESASYSKAHPKSFTGISVVDRYLDKADSASETSASKHRIERQRAIEKAEKSGQITPEYSSLLKKQSEERYEKEKVPFARSVVGFGVESVKGLDKYIPVKNRGGFTRQLGKPTPARKSTAKGRGRAPVKSFGKGFSTGISMEPAFPSAEHKVTHGTGTTPFAAQLPEFRGPGFHAPKFAPVQHKKVGSLSPKIPHSISPKTPRLEITKPKFGESKFGKQTHSAHKGGVSLGLNLDSNMFGEKKGKSKKKLFDW